MIELELVLLFHNFTEQNHFRCKHFIFYLCRKRSEICLCVRMFRLFETHFYDFCKGTINLVLLDSHLSTAKELEDFSHVQNIFLKIGSFLN